MQQHLLIDADDTLWENNIYFEQAIHEFIEFLDHSSLKPAEVRVVLNEIEREMGYGSVKFARSLQETYRRLAERDVRSEDLERVRQFGEQITQHPMQIMAGVKETLAYLSPRHHLRLLTKGDVEEQKLKVENSQLETYFEQVIVVEEKDTALYIKLVQELDLDVSKTWMIGNSPRSDINPAREAGLHAVYIPHSHTWGLEMQDIRQEGAGKLLLLHTFVELREHF